MSIIETRVCSLYRAIAILCVANMNNYEQAYKRKIKLLARMLLAIPEFSYYLLCVLPAHLICSLKFLRKAHGGKFLN